MYREQVHAARSMNKHADTLTLKTQEIDKSNEVRDDSNVARCAPILELTFFHPESHSSPPMVLLGVLVYSMRRAVLHRFYLCKRPRIG